MIIGEESNSSVNDCREDAMMVSKHDNTSSSSSSSSSCTSCTSCTSTQKKSRTMISQKPSLLCRPMTPTNLSSRLHVSTRTPSPKTTTLTFTTPSSSLSPILLHSYSSHNTNSTKKRRAGIVRRTHSPKARIYLKNATSISPPNKKHNANHTFTSPSAHNFILPSLNASSPNNNHNNNNKYLNTPLSVLKPKILVASNGQTSPSTMNAPSINMTVQMTQPTLKNVIQCSLKLKSSSIILSFPTETVYSLTTHIPLLTYTKKANPRNHSSNTWKILLELKRSSHQASSQERKKEYPMIYLYSPNQARQLIRIPKPIKSSNHTTTSISEEREVMERLMSAFWPGPTPIYAPAKQVLLTCTAATSTTDTPPTKKQRIEPNNNKKYTHRKSFPILPKSTLVPYSRLLPQSTSSSTTTATNDNNNNNNTKHSNNKSNIAATEQYFVGMRCPSHPLSRRLLGEFYFDKEQKQRNNHHHSKTKLSGVIIGFNALPSTSSTTSKDVVSHLSIHKYGSKRNENSVTVHVLDGEDKQELFMVPPCQYGSDHSSLLVDYSTRTIHILSPNKSTTTSTNNCKLSAANITIEDVQRALKQRKRNHREISQGSTGSSSEGDSTNTFSSISSQWKVLIS